MTQVTRAKKRANPKKFGVDKEFRRIVEKNLRKDRELLEKLAKI